MEPTALRYPLPESAIAQQPIEPRHTARLLDADRLTHHRFLDLPELLSPGDLVVVNSSRVRRARLRGRKEPTRGQVEFLLLSDLGDDRWEAMVRPARRLREGQEVGFGRLTGRLLSDPDQGRAVVQLTAEGRSVEEAIEVAGDLPLPPYIRGRLDDPDRYQTMFAKVVGSAAAPTAGLHFTPMLVESLLDRGIEVTDVELRIGMDTFRPVTAARLADHRIHSEWFTVPEHTAQAVEATRRSGGRVVAVGTTVTRALESTAGPGGLVTPTSGETGLFILPGYQFQVVDVLVTNFHAPASTLLALLIAFMGEGRWRRAYSRALATGYRFLSFGDGMLARRS